MAGDYLPREESQLDEWFQNWKKKMTDNGSLHGFSAGEIAQARDGAECGRGDGGGRG